MEGSLLKKGQASQLWIKRYYRVIENTLLIYKSKKDRVPYRAIFLIGTFIEPKEEEGLKGFTITLESSENKEY